MNNIERLIMSFGGHQHRVCFRVLCVAIEVAMKHSHDLPEMKTIAIEVYQKTHKWKADTVLRSLSRAVNNLWDYGNRNALVSFQPCWDGYKPFPQEFIFVVASRLKDETEIHE